MNAHTPSRLMSAAVLPVTCLVRDLAERSVAIDHRLREIDSMVGASLTAVERGFLDREVEQLGDMLDAIRRQMEWTKASSLEGVYAQVLRLRPLMEDIDCAVEGSARRAEYVRRFQRLEVLVRDALEQLGTFDADTLGKVSQGHPARDFYAALAVAG